MATTKNLKDVFTEQLKDMYSAEKQLTEALPKVAKATSNAELRKAFEKHLEVTKTHVNRVKEIMDKMDVNPGRKKCKAMEGLVEEADEMAKMKGDSQSIDAGLIAAAQKIEHYEIASYGSLSSWAKTLGENSIAQQLQSILDEEYEADKLLTGLAESQLNPQAAR